MDDIFLCDESKDLCFDDEIETDDINYDEKTKKRDISEINLNPSFGNVVGSEPLIVFPIQNDDDFLNLLKKENDFLPKHDFLARLRCGLLDLSPRREAFDWIYKAHSYYGFGPLSLCLAVNYLDRFLSTCDLPNDSNWAVQLLAVACLSIATKMEETFVPLSIEFQVGDPKFVFEAKTIQRMELLVLNTLKWRMNAVTACSFLEYSFKKLSETLNTNSPFSIPTSTKIVNRSMQLILCTIRGIDFLEFKPSEIAVAVAISVSTETQTKVMDFEKVLSCFTHLEKDRILKCVGMIKDLSMVSKGGGAKTEGVPQSPSRVLESAGFSYKSDECITTIGSGISCSPETKRKKLNTTSSSSSSGL